MLPVRIQDIKFVKKKKEHWTSNSNHHHDHTSQIGKVISPNRSSDESDDPKNVIFAALSAIL